MDHLELRPRAQHAELELHPLLAIAGLAVGDPSHMARQLRAQRPEDLLGVVEGDAPHEMNSARSGRTRHQSCSSLRYPDVRSDSVEINNRTIVRVQVWRFLRLV